MEMRQEEGKYRGKRGKRRKGRNREKIKKKKKKIVILGEVRTRFGHVRFGYGFLCIFRLGIVLWLRWRKRRLIEKEVRSIWK